MVRRGLIPPEPARQAEQLLAGLSVEVHAEASCHVSRNTSIGDLSLHTSTIAVEFAAVRGSASRPEPDSLALPSRKATDSSSSFTGFRAREA